MPTADTLENAFEQHRQRVFRAAYRVTGNVADAEDVLQTVFLNVMKRASSGALELGRDPKSYLCRAAINGAVDLLRARQRSKTSTGDVDGRIQADGGTDPATVGSGTAHGEGVEAQVERWDNRRQLRTAMARLAPRAATIVSLRYFEGYGNAEIATMLGTSASSIAVTLHRARQRLKAELKEVAP